jgi:hypothetical protein
LNFFPRTEGEKACVFEHGAGQNENSCWLAPEVYHRRMIDETAIRSRYEAMRPGLDERERRLLAAAEARTAG